MRRSVIIEIIAALLILLFLYASLSKALAYPVFAAQLRTHPLLKRFAGFLAWAVPAAELIVAALLFIPSTRRAGFTGALALMTVFTLYIAGMLLLDSHLPCSCNGILQNLTWKQHLIFNIFFTLLAFTGRKLERGIHFTKWNMAHSSPP
jgi:hypothetical protein